jgi:hypothetical protein
MSEAFAFYRVDEVKAVLQMFCDCTLRIPYITGTLIVLEILVITVYLSRCSQTPVF